MLVIYSKVDCGQCRVTKTLVKRLGLDFKEIDVTNNQQIIDELKADGFTSLPVVKTDTDIWSGFRPDRIKELAKRDSSE